MATEKRLILLDHALQAVSENYRSNMPKHELDMLVATRKRLKSIPTVDAVEVVHGRWIRKPIGKYTGVDEVCCSNCGYFVGVVASDAGFGEAIDGFNYCPNCGAKMEGE